MKYFYPSLFSLALAFVLPAQAQSSCSSDGVQPLRSFTERFTPADCADCWVKPLAKTQAGLVLDWIVPSEAGDEAVLSAAATSDATQRLGELAMTLSKDQQNHPSFVKKSPAYALRVAHGLAVNAYVGTSIELTKFPKIRTKQPLTAYLLLIERVPKGTADTPTERLLVRNILQESVTLPAKSAKSLMLARRSMSIPAGANPDNFGLVGWVQDSKGQILVATQSRCKP